MLKSIKLDNYTTFINPTIIDFSATNYKFLDENIGNDKVLKGCLFVGENASGKTQILNSIKLLLDLLLGNKDINFVINKSFYTRKNNYKLEYDFVILSKEIKYVIELNPDGFELEELYVNGESIIKRMGKNAKLIIGDEKNFDDVSLKLPFLRRVYFDTHFYDDEVLNKWFTFLRNSVYVDCYNGKITNYVGDSLLFREYFDKKSVDEFNKFLKKINYRQSIRFGDRSFKYGNIALNFEGTGKIVSFNKDGTTVFIPEILESTGNMTLVNLFPPLMRSIKNECMLILDDFGSGFHNELEECFVKYFFHYAKNSQLFFTSHSTNLLNNTILRPDQVYSVYFDGKNGSMLERFSNEMPRESQNVEKMYLNGVFHGMPRYNKKFED